MYYIIPFELRPWSVEIRRRDLTCNAHEKLKNILRIYSALNIKLLAFTALHFLSISFVMVNMIIIHSKSTTN